MPAAAWAVLRFFWPGGPGQSTVWKWSAKRSAMRWRTPSETALIMCGSWPGRRKKSCRLVYVSCNPSTLKAKCLPSASAIWLRQELWTQINATFGLILVFLFFSIYLSSDLMQYLYNLISLKNLAIRNNFPVYNQSRSSHHTVSSNLREISHMIDCCVHAQLFERGFCCSFELITFRTAAS